MPDAIQPDEVLDTRGLLCPLPIIETAKTVRRMAAGQVLEVRSDDVGVLVDMPAWCTGTGNELLAIHEEGPVVVCLVRKAG